MAEYPIVVYTPGIRDKRSWLRRLLGKARGERKFVVEDIPLDAPGWKWYGGYGVDGEGEASDGI